MKSHLSQGIARWERWGSLPGGNDASVKVSVKQELTRFREGEMHSSYSYYSSFKAQLASSMKPSLPSPRLHHGCTSLSLSPLQPGSRPRAQPELTSASPVSPSPGHRTHRGAGGQQVVRAEARGWPG